MKHQTLFSLNDKSKKDQVCCNFYLALSGLRSILLWNGVTVDVFAICIKTFC